MARVGRGTSIPAMLVLTLAVAALLAIVVFRPQRAARVAAGLTAHHLCSATFVSALGPDRAFSEMVTTLVGATVARLIGYRVDMAGRSVDATFAGAFGARARFVEGYGCRLEHADSGPAPAPLPPVARAEPTAPVVSRDPTIASALDRVFDDRPDAPPKRVKAVVMTRAGVVVAERYADGITPETPLPSYSIAKTFTNALAGVLVRESRLRVDEAVNAPEWREAGDERARITVEDLLRMQSGLDAAEEGTGFDPVSQMEFLEPDMAAFVARRPSKAPPGTRWEYTSANTVILDRLLGERIGGGAAGMRAFAERELIGPLGMSGVTMEFDGAQTFIGSTFMVATARSYARLGQLYLDDGVSPDGRRILPAGWVEWSRRATLGSSYGAGLWTNDSPDRYAMLRVAGGFPRDGFFASGVLGQRVYVVPSARLVIARFGYSAPPAFGIQDDLALIAAAIEATRAPVH